ncbi:hypothetical protein REPUB_Repub20aG0141600 [Reevesia pubescens]
MKEKEDQTPRKEHPRNSDLGANRRSKDSPAKKTSSKKASSDPSLSASSESFILSELTPSSKISTGNKDEPIDISKTGSAEVEMMVNLLNQARLQAWNSIDMDNKSKKVLDALITFTINEFYTLPQERDKIPKHVLSNAYVVFLCFVLWIVVVTLFFYSRVDCSITGRPPT